MALKFSDSDYARDEIRAWEQYRDKHLEKDEELKKRFAGNFHNSERKPEFPITENFAYELLSQMIPMLAYDNPRVQISASTPDEISADAMAEIENLMAETGESDPEEVAALLGMISVDELAQLFGGMTMGLYARGLELAANRWAVDNHIYRPLRRLAVNFCFNWGVALVTTADQPGHRGQEFAPQTPQLHVIDAKHFIMDSDALVSDIWDSNGPRGMGHKWKALASDLENDPNYDRDAIERAAADSDTEPYGYQRQVRTPRRGEIIAWDIWIPDDNFSVMEMRAMGVPDPEMYMGKWYTMGAHVTDRGITKRTYELRPPRPAYVPPWGPYAVFGYHTVPGDPYPLSILAATAERAESLNAHTNAAAEAAKAYKRNVAVSADQGESAQLLQEAANGEVVPIPMAADEIGKIMKEYTVGGVEQKQMDWVVIERELLRRLSGISESRSGQPSDQSATAEAIADQGFNTRIAGIAAQFNAGLTQVFQSAVWYMHEGPDMLMKTGPDGRREGVKMFEGGLGLFEYSDLSLRIDPYSSGFTDQGVVQRQWVQFMEWLRSVVPMMPNAPFIPWEEVFQIYGERFNIPNAGRLFDRSTYEMIVQMQQQKMMEPPDVRGGENKSGVMSAEDRVSNAVRERNAGDGTMNLNRRGADNAMEMARSGAASTGRAASEAYTG